MALQAYKVEQVLVFATRGTEAKMLAAPLIRPMEEWREDVAGWVALRSCPSMDPAAPGGCPWRRAALVPPRLRSEALLDTDGGFVRVVVA